MESRNAKLALARQKLRDHQDKKGKPEPEFISPNDVTLSEYNQLQEISNNSNLKGKDNDVGHHENFDFKASELLINDRQKLELQVKELQQYILQLENDNLIAKKNEETLKQDKISLDFELKELRGKYKHINDTLIENTKCVEDYKNKLTSLMAELGDISEQFELTKNLLSIKESENLRLNQKLNELNNVLESNQLKLSQISNSSDVNHLENTKSLNSEEYNAILQKKIFFEQQLKTVQKEKDQLITHYENYISSLNAELKVMLRKNDDLQKENDNISMRENNLMDQMSNMELMLQQLRNNQQIIKSSPEDLVSLKEQENKFIELQGLYEKLQEEYNISVQDNKEKEKKIIELQNEIASNTESICITKLNADMENDKIAAQRATEQNKKMKIDLQGLEEDFVKISKHKLELTEKLEAEKFLNRELTVKLADIVEKSKKLEIHLQAKDEEMIRLQANYRSIEKQIESLNFDNVSPDSQENALVVKQQENDNIDTSDSLTKHVESPTNNNDNLNDLLPKEHAMLKLQDRFLKIMTEVADLADEKHRLEHIITQLQNETETICEYVALYQKQRSLLKRRDEERAAQVKLFQSECEKMKNQLSQLSEIINRLSKDKHLSEYFSNDTRNTDLTQIMDLLSNMKSNFLVNSSGHCEEMNIFTTCSCCSGTMIDV